MDDAKLTKYQRETIASVAASHARDAERWTLSYTAHGSQAIRRRALAGTNGRA